LGQRGEHLGNLHEFLRKIQNQKNVVRKGLLIEEKGAGKKDKEVIFSTLGCQVIQTRGRAQNRAKETPSPAGKWVKTRSPQKEPSILSQGKKERKEHKNTVRGRG